MYSTNIDEEIRALRSVFNQDTSFARITPNQLAGLNSLINKGLIIPANRIPVLRMITGLNRLTSTKQLTLHTASTLISEWKDDEDWNLSPRGQWLISACEERVEKLARSQPLGTKQVRDEAILPNM